MLATEFKEETKPGRDANAAFVSVVVPAYNHARFIEATLRSIFKQTLAPDQLIVIDDGSSDDTPRVSARVLNDCPFACELISRSNRGLCATLNEGLERSRGEYFAYLGSDDLWLPEFLRARVKLLAARPSAVLGYGHAFFIDDQNRIIDSTADWAEYADGDARSMLLQTTAPMSPTVLYRSKALKEQPWNEASRLEDYDLYLRLSALGEFAFDPQILSAWRSHEANVSWDQGLMLEEHLRAQREAARRFGFSDTRIEELQRTTKFNRAEDFLRVGSKKQALQLMLHNVAGMNSPVTAARMVLRLLLPNSLMRRRMRRRQQQAQQRYGTLN